MSEGPPELEPAELERTRKQLRALTSSFDELSGPRGLQADDFQRAFGLRSEFVSQRLFDLFDEDHNGTIEREEFIAAVEQLVTGSRDQKLAFLFRFHDQNGDGSIDRLELERLIHLGLAESEIALPEATVDAMTDAVFEAADENEDGAISYSEFSAIFAAYPKLLDRVTRPDAVWRALRGGAGGRGQAPEPERSRGRQLLDWIGQNRAQFVVLLVYVCINAGLFVEAGLRYAEQGANLYVQLARACGACLNFNCALILVPMLRYTLSWLRAGPLGRVLPVDHSVAFHKLVGHAIVGFGVVHTGAHLANYPGALGSVRAGLLETEAGLTGLVVLISLALMWVFSSERIRSTGHFELFRSVHLLYWLFFAVLLAHGPVYWMWLLAPMLGYLIEGALRVGTRSQKVELHTRVLPSGVTQLSFNAPPGWRHRAGDYLFIRIPSLAKGEWHPFTISSAPERLGMMPAERIARAYARIARPEEGTLKRAAPSLIERSAPQEVTLHVRSRGNWTSALHELAQRRAGLDWPVELDARIDGPYGTPSAHIFNSKYAVLIGAGIGVTPFAAILDSILRRHQRGDGTSQLEKVHFVWVNRDQYSFEWFTELLAQLEAEDLDDLLTVHIYMTLGRAQMDAAALELARELFYARTHHDVVTGLSAQTNFGRPDWATLLDDIRGEHAPGEVDVFMCGPWGMTKTLRPLCRKLGMSFHHEVF